MIIAMALAGGSGTRMGAELPKQFLKLGGREIILYSIEAFLKSDKIDKVICIVPQDYIGKTQQLLANNGIFAPIIAGGADRNESLMNGIAFIEREYGLDDDTVILTHDAVRPFINERIIEDNIKAMAECDACDTCISATDTIIEGSGGYAVNMPERSNMFQCQTPQTFKAKKLKALYESLSAREKLSLTDAGKIFFLKGEKVKIVEGSRDNIKITYPSDLPLAEQILKSRENKA